MTTNTPVGIWLICGRTIEQGCTCHINDPTAARAAEAIRRRAMSPETTRGGRP